MLCHWCNKLLHLDNLKPYRFHSPLPRVVVSCSSEMSCLLSSYFVLKFSTLNEFSASLQSPVYEWTYIQYNMFGRWQTILFRLSNTYSYLYDCGKWRICLSSANPVAGIDVLAPRLFPQVLLSTTLQFVSVRSYFNVSKIHKFVYIAICAIVLSVIPLKGVIFSLMFGLCTFVLI